MIEETWLRRPAPTTPPPKGTPPYHPRRRFRAKATGHTVSHVTSSIRPVPEDAPSTAKFYTPRWLGRLILDQWGQQVLRAALSGFIPRAGRFLCPRHRARQRTAAPAQSAGSDGPAYRNDIHGFELVRASAQAARGNYPLRWASRCARSRFIRRRYPHPPVCETLHYGWATHLGRWDYLPREYREATLPLWKRYGLFSLSGYAARLATGGKDLSMLFTYASADHYLKDGGTLAL